MMVSNSSMRDKLLPFTEFVSVDKFMTVGTSECNLVQLEADANMAVTQTSEHAKKYVRQNHFPVGHPVRKYLWLALCSKHNPPENNLLSDFYVNEVKAHFSTELENGRLDSPTAHLSRLPPLVDRSHTYSYKLNAQGQEAVSRLMCLLHLHSPDITYAPMAYPIACLLLHYMREEEAYTSITALLGSCKQSHRLIQTKAAANTFKFTAICITKKYAKRTYVQIVRLCKTLYQTEEEVFDDWLWWMFRDLPFYYVVRIVDCYLAEGIKIFFRVCTAILMLFCKQNKDIINQLHRHNPTVTTQALISSFCTEISVSAEKLLKIAFGIRGLTRKEISSLMRKCEDSVRYGRSMFPITSHQKDHNKGSLQSFGSSRPKIEDIEMDLDLDLGEESVLGQMLQHIWQWLPVRVSLLTPVLLFTTEEHGTSLVTFFSKVDSCEPMLIIVKTTDNDVFGAYCSSDWANRHRHQEESAYFGTGETFLFSILPKPRKYPWVGTRTSNNQNMRQSSEFHSTSMFMAAQNNLILIGGGHGTGLQLGESLDMGRTETCDTFDNPPLARTNDFRCQVVEAFAFQS